MCIGIYIGMYIGIGIFCVECVDHQWSACISYMCVCVSETSKLAYLQTGKLANVPFD